MLRAEPTLSETAGNGYCQKTQIHCACGEKPVPTAQFERCGLLVGLLNASRMMNGRLRLRLVNAPVCATGKKHTPTGYCLKMTGGPLTRFAWRDTVTSTRSAILMKGMPLSIP
jgi:hypothetical protein